MRGREFRARDKKVQKLGRDGLVEQNKATGEERRVSQRTADISFGPERKPDQQLGRQTSKRSKKRSIRSELQSLKPDMGQTAPPAGGVEPAEGLEKPLGPHTEEGTTESNETPVIRDTRSGPAPPASDHPIPKRRREGQRHTRGLSPGPANSCLLYTSPSPRDM